MRDEVWKVIKQDIADAATEDDADRDPQHEIIEIRDGEGSLATPQLLRTNEHARVGPSDENSEDIRQGVPANGERAQVHQHRIQRRIRDNK
jgi:hypothetical protein